MPPITWVTWCHVLVQTLNSCCLQVFMGAFGGVEVHSDVTFRANIAAPQGGAVSLPSNTPFRLCVLSFRFIC
jgi:hypothetical protein